MGTDSFFCLFFTHTVGHAGSSFPDPGSSLYLLHWERGVLTTGPPRKSLFILVVCLKK